MEWREKIGDLDLEFHQLTLEKGLEHLSKVTTAMTRIAYQREDFYSVFTGQDIKKMLELMCTVTYKVSENGEKRQLLMIDLNQKLPDIMYILTIFLEVNYGFFSNARDLTERLTKIVSGRSKSD
jgi:hypothetical protein